MFGFVLAAALFFIAAILSAGNLQGIFIGLCVGACLLAYEDGFGLPRKTNQ